MARWRPADSMGQQTGLMELLVALATILHMIAAISCWVCEEGLQHCNSYSLRRVQLHQCCDCLLHDLLLQCLSHKPAHTHLCVCTQSERAQAVKQQERSCAGESGCSKVFSLKRISFIGLLTFTCSMTSFSHYSSFPCLFFPSHCQIHCKQNTLTFTSLACFF